MKLLLDTHIFLWFIAGDPQLSARNVSAIRDPDNEVFLSVISVWEAIIKYDRGKLPLPSSPDTYLPLQRERHGIASLGIDEQSVKMLGSLLPLHRDPFDRMLICQAIAHGLTLVTVDPLFLSYPAPIFG